MTNQTHNSPTTIHQDEARTVIVPGGRDASVNYCVEHFIKCANEAIADHGQFTVALSGGSTPKAIFKLLALPQNAKRVPWGQVFVFWSDERSAGIDNPDNNYRMAMDAGIGSLAIPEEHIFRMVAENDIDANAVAYEKLIKRHVPRAQFDLVTLGMGDDGHTASLFPHTEGLKDFENLVVANSVPRKKTWRMTLTFKAINQASNIAVYVIGGNKAGMLKRIFHEERHIETFPAQGIGTPEHPALWIADEAAATQLIK